MDLKNANPDDLLALEKQLCFPLYAVSRLVTQRYRPILSRFNLTYPQYLVMLALWEKDGQTVKEIGEKLLLDSATLTPMLKKLEQLDYLSRRRSPSDDRLVVNTLTEVGKALKNTAAQIPVEMACNLPIPQEFAQDLKAKLDKLMGILLDETSNPP